MVVFFVIWKRDGSKGYSKKFGVCDALQAEMWGMYLRLELARREQISHLIVQSDSKILIDMVTNKCIFGGNVPVLVKHIHKLLHHDWQVQVCRIWREDNKYVD